MSDSPLDTPPPAGEDRDSFIGQTINNKYRICQKLGGGGMATVYKAEHLALSSSVVLKFLHGHLTEDETQLERFRREAQTISRIKHPNAVVVHDFGVSKERPYLVMEYIEGQSLREVLDRESTLSFERTFHLIAQVCAAISEAHSLGIIHRDLKPDNIMVSQKKDGTEHAQVLDFGISKALESESKTENLTQTGTIMGTPKYMAPEVALEQDYDTRSDVYALGLIVYEMLSGRLPFEDAAGLGSVLQHIVGEPRQLKEANSEIQISEAINDVVMRMIAKDVSERFPDTEKAMHALRQALSGGGGESWELGTPTVVAQAYVKEKSRMPLYVMAALLVFGAGVVLWGREGTVLNEQANSSSAPVATGEPTSRLSEPAVVAETKKQQPALNAKKEESKVVVKQELVEPTPPVTVNKVAPPKKKITPRPKPRKLPVKEEREAEEFQLEAERWLEAERAIRNR